MTQTELKTITDLDACEEAVKWVEKQSSLEEAWETCERGDWMFWYLKRKSLLTKPQSVELAIRCAERVLSICEKKHSTDMRPRKALEAARAWLADPSDENKKAACAHAAHAAYAAASASAAYAACAYAACAHAACAHAACAHAACAAAAASASAAYAACAHAAACAAAAADDAVRSSEQKAQADIIRFIVKNPFK